MNAAAFVALVLTLTVATPALAAEKGKNPALAPGAGVDLRPVAMPVVVDGQVRNYVFVTVRLMPTANADLPVLREKEQFYRDAMVRAAHRTPFTLPYDYNKLDEARIIATVMAVTPQIAGRGQVKSAIVTKQQPKNIRRSPKPPAPASAANGGLKPLGLK